MVEARGNKEPGSRLRRGRTTLTPATGDTAVTGDGDELLDFVERERPDLAVVDIRHAAHLHRRRRRSSILRPSTSQQRRLPSTMASTKRVFAEAMQRGHRCLVPVSGFFEFKSSPEGKEPYLLTAPDGFPLAMAGWSRWSRPGADPVVTFAIITTAANEDVAPLHDRMPVLIRQEEGMYGSTGGPRTLSG